MQDLLINVTTNISGYSDCQDILVNQVLQETWEHCIFKIISSESCDFFRHFPNNVREPYQQSMSILPDKRKFVQLIQENKGIIYKICNSYCGNKEDRDDLAQEIVYNLWKSFHSFNPNLKFSTWMYRVALNVAISCYEKENKTRLHVSLPQSLMQLEESEVTNTEAESNINLLLKFIGELKEIDKSIMLLYLDDKSYKEIAEITGITESNVATKINRIKDKLKSKLFNQTK
jgi:RNA polymerase sigma factor (sigma-70 family)